MSLEQAFLALIEGIEAPVDVEPLVDAAVVQEAVGTRRNSRNLTT